MSVWLLGIIVTSSLIAAWLGVRRWLLPSLIQDWKRQLLDSSFIGETGTVLTSSPPANGGVVELAAEVDGQRDYEFCTDQKCHPGDVVSVVSRDTRSDPYKLVVRKL